MVNSFYWHMTGAVFKFENPETNSGLLTAEEKTTIDITYGLINFTCSSMSQIVIEIDKLNSNSYLTQCYITDGDTCRRFSASCTCLETKRQYRFTKTVTRSDSTTWRWKLTAGRESSYVRYITFNITCEFNFYMF